MTRATVAKPEVVLRGVPASPGIAIGRVFLLSGDVVRVEPRTLEENEVENEIEKFRLAIQKAKSDLQHLREKAAESLSIESAQIFEAHQLMLEDELIIDETIRRIRSERINADLAFLEIMEKFESAFAQFKDEHLKARAVDLRDVKKRVISNIQGNLQVYLARIHQPAIILAKDLTPSDTVHLDRTKVLGFATDLGGRTSHAAIMARSLKVPSVVGLLRACQTVVTGDFVILDGNEGLLIINPSPQTIQEYRKRYEDFLSFERKFDKIKDLPARTKDGKNITLSANIEFPDEVHTLRALGGYGVGLYRTEYLYLSGTSLPSEEEQFEEYRQVVENLNGHSIIFRTFDLGGDKLPRALKLPPEENPFLGLRAIRLYRDENLGLIKTQLKAILRASAFGHVRILFPMIASVSDIRYCQRLVRETKEELAARNIPFAPNVPIGAMIEVPSAAVIADLIAEECDFLSIGTNDLIQYALAVDRGNEHIADLYQPYNPAVLRMIRDTIHKGHQKGVMVGMCGEMASDPISTMLLIGMGLDEFSVSPISLLIIKEIIRRVDFSECENLAQRALGFATTEEVETYLYDVFSKKFKDLKF